MFERYTEKARRVTFLASHEASELGAHGLTTLARANGRAPRVDTAISRDPRAYDLELRGVTATEPLQVLCLVTHYMCVTTGRCSTSRWIPDANKVTRCLRPSPNNGVNRSAAT